MAQTSPENQFDRENEERQKAWNTLKTIPEYVVDYERSLKLNPTVVTEQIKKFENRWGFYPLCDPAAEFPSFDFLNSFSSYVSEVDRFKEVVNFKGLDLFSRNKEGALLDPNGRYCEDKNLPDEVEIKINIKARPTVIMNELKTKLANIQAIFGFNTGNSRMHDHLDYLVKLLVKNGFSNEEVQDRLTPPEIKKLGYDHEMRKSCRERIYERIKSSRMKS